MNTHLTSNITFANIHDIHTEILNYSMTSVGYDELNKTYIESDNCTIMSVLRYENGQYVSKHLDALTKEEILQYDKKQHKSTMILYLTDTNENTGGQLRFEKIDKTLSPQTGDLYMWINVDENDDPLLDSMHRSLPVKQGTKYCLVKFFD